MYEGVRLRRLRVEKHTEHCKYCGAKKPAAKKLRLFKNSAEAKTRAGNANAAGGGAGGRKDDAEIRKIKAEKKRLEAKVRKLELSSKKAAEDDEEEEEDDDDDDMSESRPLSKAELGRSLAGAEADQKYAAGRLNASPKSSGYLQMLEEAKKRVANINEALRKLKDPADQLRHKSERLQNLADQEKKLLQKLRTGCQVIGDAEAEVATLRERIHE